MVSKVDQDALCGHLRALLVPICGDEEATRAVSELKNLNPDTFVRKAEDISLICKQALVGNYNIPEEYIPKTAILKRESFPGPNGIQVRNVYKDAYINALVYAPPGAARDKRLAGMSNLKSAAIIEKMSRSEKEESLRLITHEEHMDPLDIIPLRFLVRSFTKYLVKELDLKHVRTYRNPPVFTPLAESTNVVILDSSGQLVTVPKGSDEATCSFMDQLRHPELNRLARMYPAEFLSILTGEEQLWVQTPENWLPEPHPEGVCRFLGDIAFAPKVAEKLRRVARVVTLLSAMCGPVAVALGEICHRWNIQCVFDQDRGRNIVLRKLQENCRLPVGSRETFYSLDQTAFTDNLSYEFQHLILEALCDEGVIKPFDLEVCDLCAHSKYDARVLGIKYEGVEFKTGQGMGIDWSFFMGSIANGYLAAIGYYMENHCWPDCRDKENPFAVIVGDDNTLFNELIALHYQEVCKKVCAKFNLKKSIVSPNCAEFCGRLITPNGIFEKKKVRPSGSLMTIKEQVEYYLEDSFIYYEKYPEFDQDNLTEFIRNALNSPQPWGVQPYDESLTPFEDRTLPQILVTADRQVAEFEEVFVRDAESGVHKGMTEKTVSKLIRRKESLPPIRNVLGDIPEEGLPENTILVLPASETEEEENMEIETVPPLLRSIVIDRVFDYKKALASNNFADVVDAAQQLNFYYCALQRNGNIRYIRPPVESMQVSKRSEGQLANELFDKVAKLFMTQGISSLRKEDDPHEVCDTQSQVDDVQCGRNN